jgi:dihydroorotate dehydrogenase
VDLYQALLRPILFSFDPETVHNIALSLVTRGLIKEHRDITYSQLEQELFGVTFKNPIGLAAGFDKNAVALSHWSAAGFGFVEIGTVTLNPQAGNPKPRMFRLPQDQGLINRLGFNNDGARAVLANLQAASTEMPYGINIGKSFTATLEDAAADYRQCLDILKGHGNYTTINVSSPNTPGLRSLQEKGKLQEIIVALREVDRFTPLFVKVAPDLELSAVDEVVEVCLEMKLTGIIATNTTISRPPLMSNVPEAGGLSGKPLRALSDKVLAHLGRSCGKQLVLIGVGGIFNGEDLFRKVSLGAHLCQVYTGWVYGGPDMVPQALEECVLLMERHGFKNLEQLRGSALSD